ncbi:MAG: hypothetical protein WD775_04375 [Burkholderiales bacterium]
MKNFKPATAFAAISAGVVFSAVSLAAGSAASRAADTAAEADYRNAIAACERLNGGETLEPDAAGGVVPTYRKLLAGEFLPENLARNTVR